MADELLYNDSLPTSERTFGSYNTNGFEYVSFANGLTATASGTQATGLVLKAMLNRVTTVATAADSVALPKSRAGMNITITNSGANSMQVFGQSPDTINAAATATGVALAAGKTATYYCPVAGLWFANLSA